MSEAPGRAVGDKYRMSPQPPPAAAPTTAAAVAPAQKPVWFLKDSVTEKVYAIYPRPPSLECAAAALDPQVAVPLDPQTTRNLLDVVRCYPRPSHRHQYPTETIADTPANRALNEAYGVALVERDGARGAVNQQQQQIEHLKQTQAEMQQRLDAQDAELAVLREFLLGPGGSAIHGPGRVEIQQHGGGPRIEYNFPDDNLQQQHQQQPQQQQLQNQQYQHYYQQHCQRERQNQQQQHHAQGQAQQAQGSGPAAPSRSGSQAVGDQYGGGFNA
ncbi:hypothetical protein F4805DRAFT_476078 [Annulohypoxylon moriforme]|nr:hypothetical protein F4805DRAFT_476078 [Annulohypoxylon moriforme]